MLDEMVGGASQPHRPEIVLMVDSDVLVPSSSCAWLTAVGPARFSPQCWGT